MITKREISYIAVGLRFTTPRKLDYAPTAVLQMTEAAKQWRKDVETVAEKLELAQQRSSAKVKTFDKAEFMKACGAETLAEVAANFKPNKR